MLHFTCRGRVSHLSSELTYLSSLVSLFLVSPVSTSQVSWSHSWVSTPTLHLWRCQRSKLRSSHLDSDHSTHGPTSPVSRILLSFLVAIDILPLHHMCAVPTKSRRGRQNPRVEFTGCYVLPRMGVGNQTLVPWISSECSYPRSHPFNPLMAVSEVICYSVWFEYSGTSV